jgi:hypothetical protein
MMRVARRLVLISTPNRLPENTQPDGRPTNIWHLREWSVDEFKAVLAQAGAQRIEWNFINGQWDGPFSTSPHATEMTMALTPILMVDGHS